MFSSINPTVFNPTKKLNINASTTQNSQVATCKLFVGNLATHTTSAHLQAIFHSYGQVIECVKVRERYGFVRFASGNEAQRALLACNGIQLNGYPMIVEYAQNEILISPLSPRTNTSNSSAPFRPHPYHAVRPTMTCQVNFISC
jgi:RNA recognition motif-containing protein